MGQFIPPYPQFADSSGKALQNGYVYIGEPDLNPETSPITVYWDIEQTLPAAQPLRTIGGLIVRSGTPAIVYFSQNTYSMTVRDCHLSTVYSDLRISSFPSFIQKGTGAVETSVQDKIRQFPAAPEDFGAVGNGTTDDEVDLQEWIYSIPTSLGGTDPGHAIQLTEGKRYKTSQTLEIGNRRLNIKGAAGGIGSGANSIVMSSPNTDILDFTTTSSDVLCLQDFMLAGAGSGSTGNGLSGGASGFAWFDSRITNMWFFGIGGKCINAVNMQGAHITNTGFDSASTHGVAITKGSNNVLLADRFFGMQTAAVSIAEGDNNSITSNMIDLTGDTSANAGVLIDVNAAGGKLARGNLIGSNVMRANQNEVILNGNNGDWYANTGVDTALVSGNLSDRAFNSFIKLDDAHHVAVVGNLIADSNEGGGSNSAISLLGDCDGVYLSGNTIVSNHGSGPLHKYGVAVAGTIGQFEPLVIGENNIQTGALGRYNITPGAHVKALPGNPDYQRFMVKHFDDFVGAALSPEWGNKKGSNGSVLAPDIAQANGGTVAMATGTDAGGTMALNGVQLQAATNWKLSNGSLVFEARVKLNVLNNIALFVGFTDQTSILEMPINSASSGDNITINAGDVIGFMFDTAMATDNWWLVSSAAAAQNSAVAPTADTYDTLRIEVIANGNAAKFYINHTLVGAQMNGPASLGTNLTPVIAAFSRTGVARIITADYIFVESERA